MTGPIEAPTTCLSIDLDALVRNWQALNARAGTAECAGIVKADAYGLGAGRVARALQQAGCRHFFTANPEGAETLRRIMPDAMVYVLNGLLGGGEDYVAHDLVPVLNDLGQIRHWSRLAKRLERRLAAVVHVDTGMSRLGLPPPETAHLAAAPNVLEPLDLHFVMSHLSCADEPGHAENRLQLERFHTVLSSLPACRASFANSSGIFLGGAWHFDLVRPGYAVYGGNPTPHESNPMEPVIRLRARIVQVREAPPGTTVGYGAGHTVRHATRLATLPVGYADGYPYTPGGQTTAWIGDDEVPVVGRVSMDLLTLDIGSLPEEKARVGTWVDLIRGRDMLDDLAARAGTNGYELLTSLGSRFPREYLSRSPS